MISDIEVTASCRFSFQTFQLYLTIITPFVKVKNEVKILTATANLIFNLDTQPHLTYIVCGGKNMSNRSPNFPAIGLSKSIVHIKNIWAKEKRSPFPPEQAATAMGYKSINGTSLQHIGALKRYGLIESRDKDFLVLSELAIEKKSDTKL